MVGVEPPAELALLPARQRGDTARLVGVPLDEGQGLEHRVVDARGDVRALLAADPGGALDVPLDGEPPHPRAADQEECACHGARREQLRGGAFAREQDDGAHRCERDAAVREGRVRAEAAALEPGEGEPAGDQRDADDRLAGEAERSEQHAAREEREHRGDPGLSSFGPRPETEVEEDPGSAGQRQQREDEPDERRVDAERPRDARAHACDHPLVRARSEGAQRHAASSYGALDPNGPRADARVEHQDALAGLDELALDVPPAAP